MDFQLFLQLFFVEDMFTSPSPKVRFVQLKYFEAEIHVIRFDGIVFFSFS